MRILLGDELGGDFGKVLDYEGLAGGGVSKNDGYRYECMQEGDLRIEAVVRAVVFDQVMSVGHRLAPIAIVEEIRGLRQLMRKHNTPVNNRIALIPLLHRREVQVLKVPIVEKQRLVLIKCNRAACIIVVDMQGLGR